VRVTVCVSAVWLRENPHTWRATVCAGALLLLATATLLAAGRHDVPDPTPVFGAVTLVTAVVTSVQARAAHRARTRAAARALAAPVDRSQAGATGPIEVDGEGPAELCPETDCSGYLVNDRWTPGTSHPTSSAPRTPFPCVSQSTGRTSSTGSDQQPARSVLGAGTCGELCGVFPYPARWDIVVRLEVPPGRTTWRD
jgi:hypothetical protein